MIQFVLKIVHMSLAVLYLYRCCIILVSPFNWFMLRVFNVKVKNLASCTSKMITNVYFFYEELYTTSVIQLKALRFMLYIDGSASFTPI